LGRAACGAGRSHSQGEIHGRHFDPAKQIPQTSPGFLDRATGRGPDHACGVDRGVRALSSVFVRVLTSSPEERCAQLKRNTPVSFTDFIIDDGSDNGDGLLLQAWDSPIGYVHSSAGNRRRPFVEDLPAIRHHRKWGNPDSSALKQKTSVTQREDDLQETAMTKNYIMSNIVMKTAYVSFIAAAVLFVCMLLLTRLHP
jgi:hypothetical protein